VASLLSRTKEGRTPLWLLIFPEGTITSDEERSKSVRYANREGIVSRRDLYHRVARRARAMASTQFADDPSPTL
jgi:1-acyl-sn-glycerol-3-phosphate acyltransferase